MWQFVRPWAFHALYVPRLMDWCRSCGILTESMSCRLNCTWWLPVLCAHLGLGITSALPHLLMYGEVCILLFSFGTEFRTLTFDVSSLVRKFGCQDEANYESQLSRSALFCAGLKSFLTYINGFYHVVITIFIQVSYCPKICGLCYFGYFTKPSFQPFGAERSKCWAMCSWIQLHSQFSQWEPAVTSSHAESAIFSWNFFFTLSGGASQHSGFSLIACWFYRTDYR